MNYQYTCCKCVYTTSFSSYDLAGKTFKSCIYCGHHTPIMQDLKALPQTPAKLKKPVSVNTSDYDNCPSVYDSPKAKYYCCTNCSYINPIYAGDSFKYCYKCNTGQYTSDSLSELMRGNCKSCNGISYFGFTDSETLGCIYCKWVCHIFDLTIDKNPAFYTSKGNCAKCTGNLSYFYLHTDNHLGKWTCSGCMAKKMTGKNHLYPPLTNPCAEKNVTCYYYASDGTYVIKNGDFFPSLKYKCDSCLLNQDHFLATPGIGYITYKCGACGAYKDFIEQKPIPVPIKMSIGWDTLPSSKVKIAKVEEKKKMPVVEKKPDSESIIAYIRDVERVYHYLNDDKFICGYSLSSSKKNNVERLSKKDQETVLKHLSSYMCVECVNVKNEAKTV